MRPSLPRWHSAHSYTLCQGGLVVALGWLHHEWPGVTKLLIQLHFVAFPIVYAGPGCEVPVCTGTTGGWPYCEPLPAPSRSGGGGNLTHFDPLGSFFIVIAVLGLGFHPHPILLP